MEIINNMLRNMLDFFFNFTQSYGWAVILLSLAVTLITLPLNLKQMQFTRAMRRVQPELEAIKKKFKDDKTKVNEATVELWAKHKVNPASGCLPMIIQMPVLWAMFNVLQVPDIFAKQPLFLGLNMTLPNPQNAIMTLGWYYWILPILTVATTFLQSKQTMQSTEPSQRTMLYMMPLFMGWFTLQFPTALALYWVSRNLFTIGQEYLYTMFIGRKTVEMEAETNAQRRKDG